MMHDNSDWYPCEHPERRPDLDAFFHVYPLCRPCFLVATAEAAQPDTTAAMLDVCRWVLRAHTKSYD